jgi:uracil-DNA glycosylase
MGEEVKSPLAPERDQPSKLALIGEAWGAEEERERTPFVGSSGYLLTQLLEEAGIARADCLLTNVFNLRPLHNKIENLCGPKNQALAGYPTIEKSKYIREEFAGELDRLGEELIEFNPNVIIALGNTALWALCGRGAISKVRGTTCYSTHTVQGFKVLPTYHPAAVQRQWELRPIAIADLIKGERESYYPDIRRLKREIWIEPSLEDLEAFYEKYIIPRSIEQGLELSIDIETAGTQITCIGFGYPDVALVIPIFDQRRKSRSYWPSLSDERGARIFVLRILENPLIRKLFQNGMYDIAFLLRSWGVKTFSATEDTMLIHHALQPESLKGLGFMASVYCDEGNWKDMRKHSTTIKKDD